jgi:hypothetical protein
MAMEYVEKRKLTNEQVQNKTLSIYSRIKNLDLVKGVGKNSSESSADMKTVEKSEISEMNFDQVFIYLK